MTTSSSSYLRLSHTVFYPDSEADGRDVATSEKALKVSGRIFPATVRNPHAPQHSRPRREDEYCCYDNSVRDRPRVGRSQLVAYRWDSGTPSRRWPTLTRAYASPLRATAGRAMSSRRPSLTRPFSTAVSFSTSFATEYKPPLQDNGLPRQHLACSGRIFTTGPSCMLLLIHAEFVSRAFHSNLCLE